MSANAATSDLEAAACVCGAYMTSVRSECCKANLRLAMNRIRGLRPQEDDHAAARRSALEKLGEATLEILDRREAALHSYAEQGARRAHHSELQELKGEIARKIAELGLSLLPSPEVKP